MNTKTNSLKLVDDDYESSDDGRRPRRKARKKKKKRSEAKPHSKWYCIILMHLSTATH